MSEKLAPGKDYIAICVNFIGRNPTDNTFLMRQRSPKSRDDFGTWEFGAGQLEFGEQPHDGVLREMKEEYGCEGVITQSLPAYSMLREQNEAATHWLVLPYVIDITDPESASIGEPEKTLAIGYFGINNLPQPLAEGAQATLEHCSDYFNQFRGEDVHSQKL